MLFNIFVKKIHRNREYIVRPYLFILLGILLTYIFQEFEINKIYEKKLLSLKKERLFNYIKRKFKKTNVVNLLSVYNYSVKKDISPLYCLSIISVESSFDSKAYSGLAYGLFQLKISTAEEMNRKYFYNRFIIDKHNLFNPKINTYFGISYISYLKNKIFRNVNSDEKKYLLISYSYHAGFGKIFKILTNKKNYNLDIWKSGVKLINQLSLEEIKNRIDSSLIKKGFFKSYKYPKKVFLYFNEYEAVIYKGVSDVSIYLKYVLEICYSSLLEYLYFLIKEKK